MAVLENGTGNVNTETLSWTPFLNTVLYNFVEESTVRKSFHQRIKNCNTVAHLSGLSPLSGSPSDLWEGLVFEMSPLIDGWMYM